MTQKLPPIPKDAFDGEKYESPVPKDKPLEKRCKHKGKVALMSSTEIKCQCGTGWSGSNVKQLFELLK